MGYPVCKMSTTITPRQALNIYAASRALAIAVNDSDDLCLDPSNPHAAACALGILALRKVFGPVLTGRIDDLVRDARPGETPTPSEMLQYARKAAEQWLDTQDLYWSSDDVDIDDPDHAGPCSFEFSAVYECSDFRHEADGGGYRVDFCNLEVQDDGSLTQDVDSTGEGAASDAAADAYTARAECGFADA